MICRKEFFIQNWFVLPIHDTVEIDSRTSDAVALAVSFGCPIYTYDNILESAGILMEEDDKKKKVVVSHADTEQ